MPSIPKGVINATAYPGKRNVTAIWLYPLDNGKTISRTHLRSLYNSPEGFELAFSYRGNRIPVTVDSTLLDSVNYTFFDSPLTPFTNYTIYIHSFSGTEEADSAYTLPFATLPAGEGYLFYLFCRARASLWT